MYDSSGLEFVVLTAIGIPVSILVVAIIMVWKGRQRNSLALMLIGFVIGGLVVTGAAIYFASEIYKRVLNDQRYEQNAIAFLERIPVVYAPDTSYIAVDFKSKKPELKSLLYRKDAYEFELEQLALSTELRGYKKTETNLSMFNPGKNVCNFEFFYPNASKSPAQTACKQIAKDENGNAIYTNVYPASLRQSEYYYGIIETDTLVIVETFFESSEHTSKIVDALSNLKRYEHADLEKHFHLNASVGLTR